MEEFVRSFVLALKVCRLQRSEQLSLGTRDTMSSGTFHRYQLRFPIFLFFNLSTVTSAPSEAPARQLLPGNSWAKPLDGTELQTLPCQHLTATAEHLSAKAFSQEVLGSEA